MSEEPEDLPLGWMSVAIGDVTETKVDQQGPVGKGVFTYVDISSVDNSTKVISDAKLVPVKDAPSRARQRIRSGDVLVSMTRPNLNAVAKVPRELDGAIASTGFDVLRSRGVEQNWLFAHVQSKAFIDSMSDLVRGALYPAVNSKEVRDYRIPLPPLPEQRRIVTKIEALQAHSRGAREALESIPRLMDQFRQSVLAAAFRGDLTVDWRDQNPDAEPAGVLLERIRAERCREWEKAELAKFRAKGKVPKDNSWKEKYIEPEHADDSDLPELPHGWCWASFDELSSAVQTLTYGVVQPGDDVDDGVPLVRVCDINDGLIETSGLRKITKEVAEGFARTRLSGGELLITIVGTIGRVAVVPRALAGANIARAVARMIPVTPVTSEWISSWLMTGYMQDWLLRQSCEVARKTLNLKELQRAAVPLAPLSEMQRLIKTVATSLKQTRSLIDGSLEGLVDEVARLDQSILAKAFRGELVPQDPNDEPASALLERIQAERADDTNGKPARGRRKQVQ